MVLAVFLGARPTAGYGVAIDQIAAGEREIRVTVLEQTPAPGALVAQALTQPFQMVVVPRSALPVTFVRAAKTGTPR